MTLVTFSGQVIFGRWTRLNTEWAIVDILATRTIPCSLPTTRVQALLMAVFANPGTVFIDSGQ